MSDRLEKLEAELGAMRLRPISSNVVEAIEADLSERLEQRARPWGDRMLICSMCSGAIAACVIVVTLLSEPASSLPSVAPVNSSIAAPRLGDYPLALARADSLSP